SFPERPTARPPWWLIRPTISLLMRPTRTISTISIVSSSVTRMPPTNRGSFPSRFMSAPIWGPPPCTMTGCIPTYLRRMTSRAKLSASCGDSIAWPPYLITKVLPQNARMYGSASIRVPAFSTSRSMPPVTVPSATSVWCRPAAARRRRATASQDIPADVVVAEDVRQPGVDVGGVEADGLAGQRGSVERDLLEQPLEDRVEPAGAD